MSLAFALLLQAATAGQAAPAAMPKGDGPQGTSDAARYDTIGYGTVTDGAGVAITAASLPAGSIVEVTALDTGRTILARVAGAGAPLGLSPLAARALGVGGPRVPLRVRRIDASPADQHALATGQPAGARIDAPPALLVALRKRLPAEPGRPPEPRAAVPPAVRPPAPQPGFSDEKPPVPLAPSPRPAPVAAQPARQAPPRPTHTAPPVATGHWYVQIAALSAPDRARALARTLGGRVADAGRFHRVQLGPFADAAAATRARDDAARRGYGGGKVLRLP